MELKLLILQVLVCLCGAADNYYNILTFDGGGLRGIIPAVVLQEMEIYAFEYATKKNYAFPKYPGREGLFAMKDLFDMTSGTSTGSIIAAGLVYPNPNVTETEGVTIKGQLYRPPGFFAKDLLEIYT
jgi:patatin-like phospholipase/acyl hydrolase